MPRWRHAKPILPESSPEIPPEADFGRGAESGAISARLRRILGVHDDLLEGASGWLSQAYRLLGALKHLSHTSANLIKKARRVADEGATGEANSSAMPAHLIDAEILADLRAQFQALLADFPDASDLFFGVDRVDEFLSETLAGRAQNSLRQELEQLVEFLDARTTRLMGHVIEWGTEERAADISMARLEGFVRGLEALLQEILDRWVIPAIYDSADDADNHKAK